jgi:hypothetical protein
MVGTYYFTHLAQEICCARLVRRLTRWRKSAPRRVLEKFESVSGTF